MGYMRVAERFFFENAGYSYNPATETREQGRAKCAAALARAERNARSAGIWFEWSLDDLDSSEWSDERPSWAQYRCLAMNQSGRVVAALGGIDFGRDGTPSNSSYRRVVEAELATEALADTRVSEL